MKLQCVLSNRLTLVVIDLINYVCVCCSCLHFFSEFFIYFLLLLPSLTNSLEGESPGVEYLFNLLLLRVLACWKKNTIKITQECSILPWSGEQTNSAHSSGDVGLILQIFFWFFWCCCLWFRLKYLCGWKSIEVYILYGLLWLI